MTAAAVPWRAAGPPLDLRRLVVEAAARLALLRLWWALWPAVLAVELLVAAPLLHWIWTVLRIPQVVIAVALATALAFAAASTLERRAGWPRVITGVCYCWIIWWGFTVWHTGPTRLLIELLGWSLVVAWPVWVWHRWWRDKSRFVQVAENRWERRAGAPDPGLDRIGRLLRRLGKRRRRARNRANWATRSATPAPPRATRPAQGATGAPEARVETVGVPEVPDALPPARQAVLDALAEIGEPTSAADVARWLTSNRETVRRHLVGLADSGHAVRTGDPRRPLYAAADATTTGLPRARARASDAPGVRSDSGGADLAPPNAPETGARS